MLVASQHEPDRRRLVILVGGVTADTFGPLSTFQVSISRSQSRSKHNSIPNVDFLARPQVTFVLLVLSSFLSFFFLPPIPPPTPSTEDKKSGGILSFLSPLKVFVPRKVDDNSNKRYYGLLLLGLGIWFGVLATGQLLRSYSPPVVQTRIACVLTAALPMQATYL